MGVVGRVRVLLFGEREAERPCPEPSDSSEYELRAGEFFDPEPGSWTDGTDRARAVGPARIELGRLGPRRFRLLRHAGYRDPLTGQTWVVPRSLDTWTFDFSSAPVLVNWIIPVLGSHFNAFVLHDALVEVYKPGADVADECREAFGPRVAREEADRIARDAMKEQGTDFIRRWIAWVGMLVGSIMSEEGIGGPKRRRWFRALFLGHIGVLLALGFYSTGEVLGWWQNLPWMAGEEWPVRLLWGAAGAVVVPVALSAAWLGRWRFGLLAGVLLAVLLPALAITALVTILYVQAERLFRRLGYTRRNACTLAPETFGRRDGSVG